ncbi:PREDICTED: probable carboxylesterase 12 [Prunus mume]|uniref:Probable carboxylesterase 12 n=1 Tax=Prunus mume TaxID=102107 RepID=A0ABM1LSR4_PRUMU|nr:PREDICTED: probable carboxylesterase 12 [Prunus mume]
MSNEEIAHDFSPMIKVYKDGRVERLLGTSTVPPSTHPENGVQSKDVVISQEPAISARLYIPKSAATSSPQTTLRAPEIPLPAAYDDSWAALKWVASHFDGNGSEDWLNRFADLRGVFFGGDSAGANIAHNMALKLGCEGLVGVKLIGIVLIHPYFWGTEPVGEELTIPEAIREYIAALWLFTCPLSIGSDDPLFNPGKDPKLGELGCEKVLVCVAEKDGLKDRGWHYCEVLKKSGWKGIVEVIEAKGEEHGFHLFNPNCENAVAMKKKIASFLN